MFKIYLRKLCLNSVHNSRLSFSCLQELIEFLRIKLQALQESSRAGYNKK